MPEQQAAQQDCWLDLQPVLDQELSGLPDKYRITLILCDLEGKTRKQAARLLACPEGTIAGRLARARKLLARRLSRRGIVISGGALAALLARKTAAAVPASVVASTIPAVTLLAGGRAATMTVISVKVAALTEGVLKTMLFSKLKIASLAFLVLVALGIGARALTRSTQAADPGPADKSGSTTAIDGNLKETVLALEKRIWEAHSKQDVAVFKNLLADDFTGTDMFGRPYDKAGTLDYVAKFRVIEYAMTGIKVIPLNATSAIVSYQIDYKVRPTNGQEVESATRRATAAWAQRKGRWWYVYFEDRPVQKEGATLPLHLINMEQLQDLSEVLRKINAEKKPPEN
jgi:hypothetical protein